MKRLLAIIGLIIVLLLPTVAFSCSSNVEEENIKAKLGVAFDLMVGKTAEIEGEYLSIQFIEVTADSRCPNYAKCVWAGEAKCRMVMKIVDSPAEMTLTQPGGTTANGSDYFISYKINFVLKPYPEVGKEIAPSDYWLSMTITKP
jgi:hypothetical protein